MKTQRKRYISFNKIIRNIVIMVAIIIFFNIFICPIIGKEDMTTKTITVASNDTLWNIASNVKSNSKDKSLNINKVIYEIKDLNNLEDSNIYIGQSLEIPLY